MNPPEKTRAKPEDEEVGAKPRDEKRVKPDVEKCVKPDVETREAAWRRSASAPDVETRRARELGVGAMSAEQARAKPDVRTRGSRLGRSARLRPRAARLGAGNAVPAEELDCGSGEALGPARELRGSGPATRCRRRNSTAGREKRPTQHELRDPARATRPGRQCGAGRRSRAAAVRRSVRPRLRSRA
ncbi:hypothetical protein Abr02nite_35820 [Paractinoplanes brasiliensis]|nr:hypothetical protein Abr02nite_35820 [Actinoplanes brasiliensis]